MKTLKYQWFDEERGKSHHSAARASVVLYFAGFGAWFISFVELLMAHFVNAFFCALAGIWLFIMFAVFCEMLNTIRIRDMLDRIYFRTPANFERYKARVFRNVSAEQVRLRYKKRVVGR